MVMYASYDRPMSVQDFSLVLSAAKGGDGSAFDHLFASWNNPITAFVRSRGVAECDDLVKESFLGAFRSIGSFSGDEADFRSWLYRIARNKIADELLDGHR
jgi:RNA polymerase sigma factor (sigma-70 family)